MDWTTVNSVNERRGRSTDKLNDDQVLILKMIKEISAELEIELGRHVEIATRTETHMLRAGEQNVHLDATPILALTSVISDSSSGFLTPQVHEITSLSAIADQGLLIMPCEASGRAFVRVEYSGGMAADTADFMGKYPDLAAACESLVIYTLQTSRNPAVTGKSVKGGDIAYSSSAPAVRDAYRRVCRHARITWSV